MDRCFRSASCHNRQCHDLAYTPYGVSVSSQCSSRVGFAGQWQDTHSGCYLLGMGRRMYDPSLGRFVSPDVLSPFGSGGVNAYAYCAGDPVNYVDPSGLSRSGVGRQANPQKRLDISVLKSANLRPSLYPQLANFRQQAKGMTGRPMERETVVARIYKHGVPHYGYNRWDLTYNFAADEFSANFVYGSPILHLPAGNDEVKKNNYVLGVGAFQPARGLRNYKSYEVRKADLGGFSLPAAQHPRAQLAESAWPEVAKAIWDVRLRREVDQFDKMLQSYSPPDAPTPPPRRR